MKHIGEIIAKKSVFSSPREKGSGEWRAFSVVRGDRVDMFPVSTPRRAVVTREANHVLRIAYPHASSEIRLRGAH